MFESVLNKTNSYFDESYSPTPIINTSPKSIDLMLNTSPLFNNPLTPPYNKLPRMKYLKQALENYRFCQNSGNDAYGRKGRGVPCLRHYDALRMKIDM